MQSLLKRGLSPTLRSVNLLLFSLTRAGRYQLLLHVFSQISSNSVPANICTETLVVRALLKSERFREAVDLISRGESSHLSHKKRLWDALIHEVCIVGEDPERGFAFLQECVTSIGVRPSVRTFRSLVSSFCWSGEVDRAIEVVGMMTSQKVGYPLDSYVCSSIISGFYRAGKPDLAKGFLENARKDDESLIYNDAIVLLSKKNYCEIAVELYTLARKKHLVVAVKSYYVLLKGLFRNGYRQLVPLMICSCLKEHGLFEPKVINILSLLLCKKDVDKALQFLNQREKKIFFSSVSTAIVVSLKRVGRIKDAYKLVMEAEGNGIAVDAVTYSIVVDGLCKEGYLEKALLLCTMMRNKGLQPNIFTYNSVINGLCQQGCLVEAFRIFDSLEPNNLAPTVVTYATLIRALSREGYLADAKLLFEKLIRNGVIPNMHVYNLLINGYCSFGLVEEAKKLLLHLEKSSMQPDAFTISSVVNGFCMQGDMEGALGLYTECKRRGVTLDFRGFFFLIEGLCAKGRLEEARTILQDMLQCHSVTDIINKVGIEVGEVSLVSLLGFLCEQGRIEDAFSVLSEVGSYTITAERFIGSHRHTVLERLYKVESLDTGSKVDGSEVESLIGRAKFQDFEIYYPVIVSLCWKGELQKASSALKHVLINSGACS